MPPSGLSIGLATRGRQIILHGLVVIGQFTVHISLILHVELLNLLSPDMFQESKWSKMRWLTALPRPPSWIKEEGRDREKDGKGRRWERGR